MNGLFKELILIAIGKQQSLSRIPSDAEWGRLYDEAEKQSLIGVIWSAIETIPSEQRPYLELLMEWAGMTERIKTRNGIVNKRAAEVTKLFAESGFRSCVLKGQGVALLYMNSINPNLRTPGDIDLWVNSERRKVLSYLDYKGWKVGRTVIHHTDVKIFPDIDVEIHHIPSYTFSPFRYSKYLKWFKEQMLLLFDANVNPNADIAENGVGYVYPSVSFNAVYSLLHIFRHVFHEGIGLRQLLDYYFILQHLTEKERKDAMKTLKWMGLERFVAAIMYVEQTMFSVPEEVRDERFLDESSVKSAERTVGAYPEWLLCGPDVEAGQFLLDEILTYGNFGKYNDSTRKAHQGGSVNLYMHNVNRLLRMIRFYPSEVLWAPIWKPVHKVWRLVNGF